MPYLDAVLMECNRLRPAIHAVLRSVIQDTVLTSGPHLVHLQPGTMIYLSLMYANTSTKNWGETAGDFVPERWIDRESKKDAFLGFGYGLRSCVSLI